MHIINFPFQGYFPMKRPQTEPFSEAPSRTFPIFALLPRSEVGSIDVGSDSAIGEEEVFPYLCFFSFIWSCWTCFVSRNFYKHPPFLCLLKSSEVHSLLIRVRQGFELLHTDRINVLLQHYCKIWSRFPLLLPFDDSLLSETFNALNFGFCRLPRTFFDPLTLGILVVRNNGERCNAWMRYQLRYRPWESVGWMYEFKKSMRTYHKPSFTNRYSCIATTSATQPSESYCVILDAEYHGSSILGSIRRACLGMKGVSEVSSIVPYNFLSHTRF